MGAGKRSAASGRTGANKWRWRNWTTAADSGGALVTSESLGEFGATGRTRGCLREEENQIKKRLEFIFEFFGF